MNKLRKTRPAKTISTFFDTLFPEYIPVARGAPLLRKALALFEEHFTAADGAKVQIHAQKAVDLISRTAAEWRTDFLCGETSATHASELQVQLAALEAKLANPFEENPVNHVLKTRGSADVAPQEHHIRFSSSLN